MNHTGVLLGTGLSKESYGDPCRGAGGEFLIHWETGLGDFKGSSNDRLLKTGDSLSSLTYFFFSFPVSPLGTGSMEKVTKTRPASGTFSLLLRCLGPPLYLCWRGRGTTTCLTPVPCAQGHTILLSRHWQGLTTGSPKSSSSSTHR